MFKFCSLFSGSSGNSSFIQTDTTKILIDCGESAKRDGDEVRAARSYWTQCQGVVVLCRAGGFHGAQAHISSKECGRRRFRAVQPFS